MQRYRYLLLEVGAEEAVEKCPTRNPADVVPIEKVGVLGRCIVAHVELALDDGVAFGGHGRQSASNNCHAIMRCKFSKSAGRRRDVLEAKLKCYGRT